MWYTNIYSNIMIYQKCIGISIKEGRATRSLYASSGPMAERVPTDNQKSKMADENFSDDDIPSNQEGNYAKDMDLYFTLKSYDEKSEHTAQFDQDSIANECIDTVKQLMVERHEIAKAKESLTYGLQSSKYPPWMTSQLHCKLSDIGPRSRQIRYILERCIKQHNKKPRNQGLRLPEQ